MLYFPEKSHHPLKSTTTLTNAYVSATAVGIDEHNYMGIGLTYVKGDETSIQIKFESSMDYGVTYFQQAAGAISSEIEELEPGIYQLTAANFPSGTSKITWKIHPFKSDAIKMSVKATGGTPTGTWAAVGLSGWV